jgi:hypothetical protein
MEEEFEPEEADGEGRVAGGVARIEQDWSVVTGLLPAQWECTVELGAVRRLRGFSSVVLRHNKTCYY